MENSIKFLDKILEISEENDVNLVYDILGNREKPDGYFFVRLDTFIDFKINKVKLVGINHIIINNQIANFSIGDFSNSGTKIAEIDLKDLNDPTDFKMEFHDLNDNEEE